MNSGVLVKLPRARIGISWYFFNCGMLVGNYVSRIPSLKEEHNISDGVLGIVLLCCALGSIVCLPVVSRCNHIFGSAFSTFIGSLGTAFVLPLIGVIDGGLGTLFTGMFATGFGLGFADVSANAQAVVAEKLSGLPQMGLFHATYAVGSMVGALIGGVFAEVHVSTFNHLFLMSSGSMLVSLLFYVTLFTQSEERDAFKIEKLTMHQRRPKSKDASASSGTATNRNKKEPQLIQYTDGSGARTGNISSRANSLSSSAEKESSSPQQSSSSSSSSSSTLSSSSTNFLHHWIIQTKYFGLNNKSMFFICVIGFIAYMAEGSIEDWTTVYFTESLNASPIMCSIGFAVFCLAIAVGRFMSDSLVQKFGSVRLLQLSGLVSSFGLVLVVIAPSIPGDYNLLLATIALGVSGAGLSLASPIVASSAGRIPGMTPSDSISTVTSFTYCGYFIGPPLFGGLAELLGSIRWSLFVDALFICLIAVFATNIPPDLIYKTALKGEENYHGGDNSMMRSVLQRGDRDGIDGNDLNGMVSDKTDDDIEAEQNEYDS